jgi:Sec-independent protein secretion pathway component TatC
MPRRVSAVSHDDRLSLVEHLVHDDVDGRLLRGGALVFQLPLFVLAITRLGIVGIDQLTGNRRYAYLVIAIIAAALPGVDPISMIIEMVPLLILFELSILLAKALGGTEKRIPASESSW